MPDDTLSPLRSTLLDALDRALAGDPWHGTALDRLLRDVPADAARATPVAGAHSIWAITLHCAAWTDEVAQRLAGEPPSEPRWGDWPAVPPDGGDAEWHEARARLADAHARARAALLARDEAHLRDEVGDGRDPALGTGLTHAAMVAGLVQHHAYHGGQVALLRRALGLG